jgi:hypothetical protein
LNGLRIAHRGKDLPYPALTNDTYEKSVEYVKKSGTKTGKSTVESLDRFAHAAGYQKTAKTPADAVAHAFAMLDNVAQGDHTQWSIVYDLQDHRAYFRTRAARDVRWIDIDGLALDCNSPVRMLDMNAPLSGDVSAALKPYNTDANVKLVRSSFAKTPFLSETSPDMRDEVGHYPDATTCGTETGARGGK